MVRHRHDRAACEQLGECLDRKVGHPNGLHFPYSPCGRRHGNALYDRMLGDSGPHAPVSSNCSICFQVSTTVGYCPHGICSPNTQNDGEHSCGMTRVCHTLFSIGLRPMNQVQIDVVQTKCLERCFERLADLVMVLISGNRSVSS